jgi:hypothetical protein
MLVWRCRHRNGADKPREAHQQEWFQSRPRTRGHRSLGVMMMGSAWRNRHSARGARGDCRRPVYFVGVSRPPKPHCTRSTHRTIARNYAGRKRDKTRRQYKSDGSAELKQRRTGGRRRLVE